MGDIYIKIPKSKAVLPAAIVSAVLGFIGFAFHFGFFGWTGGLIFSGIYIAIASLLYVYKRGEYFVKADRKGISWRQGIISKLIYIPWEYLQRVDYLVYEINFMLKETAQVVSFATSGLNEDEAEKLKRYISDVLGDRKSNLS